MARTVREAILSAAPDVALDFRKATISESLDLRDCDIGHVDFRGATFAKQVLFRGCRFHGVAWFDGCRFSAKADFSRSRFDQDARFDGTHFAAEVDFSRAEVAGVACFDLAVFSSAVSFDRLLSFGSLSIGRAQFLGSASFRLTECSGGLWAQAAVFHHGFDAHEFEILGLTNFSGARQVDRQGVSRPLDVSRGLASHGRILPP